MSKENVTELKIASAIGDFSGLVAQVRRALPDPPASVLALLETAERNIHDAAGILEAEARGIPDEQI